MPRLTAEAIAPPAPWANRAAISIGWLTDTPQSTEAAMKTARPARKTRLPPIRSPSRPASSSRPPNAIRYAFTTQASPDAEKPRSRWIAVSATVTMVPSRMIIIIAAQSTVSASQWDASARDASARDRPIRIPPQQGTICYYDSLCYGNHDV